MENFIYGLLISNEPNAVYEESVFDRYLTFKTKDDQFLHVFDPFSISGEVEIDHFYNVIVKPYTNELVYLGQKKEDAESIDTVFGKIVNLDWTLPDLSSGTYVTVAQDNLSLKKRKLVLVETLFGIVCFSASFVERKTKLNLESLQLGEWLQWTNPRYDLVAVLSD